tara:strand:+ start:1177 stop:1479 length:303 start_codon:yes stop_codon:yes gene_type:complete
MAVKVTKPPEDSDQVIPEAGPESYVTIGMLRHPIVAWRWDGERGHPLVAFEDGVWEAEWIVVQEMCVRGQMIHPRPEDDEGDWPPPDYDTMSSDLQRRDD